MGVACVRGLVRELFGRLFVVYDWLRHPCSDNKLGLLFGANEVGFLVDHFVLCVMAPPGSLAGNHFDLRWRFPSRQ
jgi:hypothetical protein